MTHAASDAPAPVAFAAERWPSSPEVPRPGAWALALLAAVAIHAVVLTTVGVFDGWEPARPTAAEEIPVEIVPEPPDEPASTPQPPATPRMSFDLPGAQSAPPPAVPAPETETREPEKPEAADTARSGDVQQAPQAAEGQAQGQAQPPAPRDAAGSEAGSEQASIAVPAPAREARAGEADGPRELPSDAIDETPAADEDPPPPVSERDAATAAFPFVPPTFRTAARPAAKPATSDSYKAKVFALLEAAKRYPPAAEARGAAGTAVLTFLLDTAGNVVTVSLIRSTGDRELDAEAVAMVRRISPLPKPPNGVLLSFTPLVRFGLE